MSLFDDQDIFEMIHDLPMFALFSDVEKRFFSQTANTIIDYNAGEVIINEGDEHGALYLLLEGSVMITKSGYDYVVCELYPGAIFGEMSFFTKKARHNNVIASEDVLVIKMDTDFFKQIDPVIKDKIKNYLIELLINRLDAMNDSLVKISTQAEG